MTPPLAVNGLVFEAGGKRLLRGLDFQLEAGRRGIILGANGAGKSLVLRLCHGLLRPTNGSIACGGRQAMVFQRPIVLRRSAAANVDYGLALKGIAKARRVAMVDDVLERTGLTRHRATQARALSFGEQQRLALARAWALDPDVLFLDEPTANLDPAATQAVEDIVNAIHAAGTCIVMTTHDLGQARRMADDVLFLHRGRLVEKTPAARFFDTPESAAARAFIRGELLW